MDVSNLISPQLRLILLSHGIKHGSMPKADFYVDCRCVADPLRGGETSLGGGIKFIEKFSHQTLATIQFMISDAIELIPARRHEKTDPFADPFIICFFCAHGMHRSPAVKHIMSRKLLADGYKVEIK